MGKKGYILSGAALLAALTLLAGCGNSGRTGGFTGLGGSLLGAGRLGNGICRAVCGRGR